MSLMMFRKWCHREHRLLFLIQAKPYSDRQYHLSINRSYSTLWLCEPHKFLCAKQRNFHFYWTSIALVGQRSIKEAEVSQLPRSIELFYRGAFCCVQRVDFWYVCNIVPRLKTPSCNSCMQAIVLSLLLLLILSSSAWQNHWINALWYCVLFLWNNREHIFCNLKP